MAIGIDTEMRDIYEPWKDRDKHLNEKQQQNA